MGEMDAEKAASSESPKALHISRGDKRESPTKIAAFGIPLYPYAAVPSFLQGNPYITDGYRAHLSPKLCVKSACILSNETVNIWSHMLGLVYFTLLQINDNFHFLPENGADAGDHFTFTIMNLCFQACMFCSAGYHMFYCQSELASRRWLSLDLAGVSVGMCGCYFPGAYYAFYCDVLWRTIYTVVMMVLAFASLFAQAHSQFLSDHWYMRRLVLYSAFVFAGVVPVMHWVVHNGGFSDPLVQFFMPKITVMYIITVIGGFFYVSRFPEKILPGKVNMFGSSHQWWHLMVVLSFTWAHHMGEEVFIYWRSHNCNAVLHGTRSDIGWTALFGLN